MAKPTIQNIRDEIVTEVGIDSSDSVALANVLQFIKSAARRFPDNIRSRGLTNVQSVSHSSGRTVSAPDGLISVEHAYYESGGIQIPVDQKKDPKAFSALVSTSALGAPQFFRRYKTTIEFDRQPDQTYTVYLYGTYDFGTLALSTEWVFDNYGVEVLKDGAKEYYYRYEEDAANAAVYAAKFAAGLSKLEEDYLTDDLPDYVEEA